jgi:AcrR family transcriptional regulator
MGLSRRKVKTKKVRVTDPKYHHGDLRRAILEAALELIGETGVSSLSLREIARRIGVTTAAPYHHFKDRGELLLQIGMLGYSQLLLVLEEAAATTGDAEKVCEAEFRAYLHFARKHSAVYAVMFSAELPQYDDSRKVKTVADRCFALVCGSVARCRSLSEKMSAEAALSIWALMHGLVVLDQSKLLEESRSVQERIALQAALVILRGLPERPSTI